MKYLYYLLVAGSGLIACSEQEYPNLDYIKGRQRAEMEGCHCNASLPRSKDRASSGRAMTWGDGYVESCIRFRKERRC